MRILVAEDDRSSRLLLAEYLRGWGHQCVLASDGREAWEALAGGEGPRVVLLDWMMPEMDGLEVCRRLRAERDWPYCYVILVTAREQRSERDAAFEAGVDDFIVKPYDKVELCHRLNVGIRVSEYEADLRNQGRQLELYASEMERLAEERAKQLVHADRMATLGLLAAGIAHEVNNPTTFISGNLQNLEECWDDLEAFLDLQASLPNRVAFLRSEARAIFQGMHNGVDRISNIVNGLNVYSRQSGGEKEPVCLAARVDNALGLCHNALKYKVRVEKDLGEGLPLVWVHAQQIEQVLVNLFINAAHAMEDQSEGQLGISARMAEGGVELKVCDGGPGIAQDQLEKIWNPFFTTKEVGKGTGLGLSISKGIIEEHGGTISVQNRPGGGACFRVWLPAAEGSA